LAVGFPKTWRD